MNDLGIPLFQKTSMLLWLSSSLSFSLSLSLYPNFHYIISSIISHNNLMRCHHYHYDYYSFITIIIWGYHHYHDIPIIITLYPPYFPVIKFSQLYPPIITIIIIISQLSLSLLSALGYDDPLLNNLNPHTRCHYCNYHYHSHRIHVWNIYQHLPHKWPKCR